MVAGRREVSLPLPGKKPTNVLLPDDFMNVPAVKPRMSALSRKRRLLPPAATRALTAKPPCGIVAVAVSLRFWMAAPAEAAGRTVAATLS